MYDVAERAGVSIATVSRVHRNPESVRAGARDRVLDAARELGCVPSGNARGLASRSTGVLGLCFPDHAGAEAEEHAGPGGRGGGDSGTAEGPDGSGGSGGPDGSGGLDGSGGPDDPDADAHPDADADEDADEDGLLLYCDEIIRGMERAARRHGYALLITASLPGGPGSPVAEVAGRVDGFAVLADAVPAEDLKPVSGRLPAVLLAGPRGADHLDHIGADNRTGAREPARHLIADHGHRRLAFVGDETGPPTRGPASAASRTRCGTRDCRFRGPRRCAAR